MKLLSKKNGLQRLKTFTIAPVLFFAAIYGIIHKLNTLRLQRKS